MYLKKEQYRRVSELVFNGKIDLGEEDHTRFRHLDVKVLGKLLKEKLIDPEENQNGSPTTKEFFDFMKKYPQFLALGYVISKDRDDARISIEGIENDGSAVDAGTMQAFIEEYRFADEFICRGNQLYAWWD